MKSITVAGLLLFAVSYAQAYPTPYTDKAKSSSSLVSVQTRWNELKRDFLSQIKTGNSVIVRSGFLNRKVPVQITENFVGADGGHYFKTDKGKVFSISDVVAVSTGKTSQVVTQTLFRGKQVKEKMAYWGLPPMPPKFDDVKYLMGTPAMEINQQLKAGVFTSPSWYYADVKP